jgi:3-deoxy-D-manno-octulosonate 8-phosphate phosphatase (KDO 8-P phosphatase)
MIDILIVDIDGVLTDGKQYIGPDGEKMFKAFHSKDIAALRFLVSEGIRVIAASADDWDGAIHWCDKVGIEYQFTRHKEDLLKQNSMSKYAAIGDSIWDKKLLEAVELAFCPSDADWHIRQIPGIIVLPVQGGQGVTSHMIGHIFKE